MIKKFIQNIFKKIPLRFYDQNGIEVNYLQFFEKEQMITIQTENGIEKIPVLGLDKRN